MILATLLSAHAMATLAIQTKPAVTFAFFGCNRVDAADVTPQNPSTANVMQLTQNMRDVANLRPNYLFLGGDLVMNYADDRGETLKRQLDAWYALAKTVPLPGTDMVAIPGNHETNRKVGDEKMVNPWTERVWTKFVDSHGLQPKKVSNPYAGDQNENMVSEFGAKTNYSFDRGPVHFVVLNTDTRVSMIDPESGKLPIGMVPMTWITEDVEAAQRDPKITSIIVMGHRNVIDGATAKGDAPINPICAGPLTDLLKKHTKVRAYVCAHVHALDITPFPGGDRPLQTIFGAGGSKLEKTWKPAEGRTFGFGYFEVFRDGTVKVTPYVRPEAPDGYLSLIVPPATPRNSITIAPPK